MTQTHTLWELIIVDDGSTDNTKQVIDSFTDSRIRYLYQQNAGGAAARNNGVTNAKGVYIIFLDSDDTAEPDWLDAFVQACDQQQDVVTCGLKRFNASGTLIEERIANTGHRLQQRYGIYLAGTYMINRELFLNLGSFDTELKSGHHTELLIRLIQRIDNKEVSVARINRALVNVYDHAGEKIRGNWRSIYEGSERTLQKHFQFMKANDLPWLQSYYTVLARSAHALKLRKEAVVYGWKAVGTSPLILKNWLRLGRYLFT